MVGSLALVAVVGCAPSPRQAEPSSASVPPSEVVVQSDGSTGRAAGWSVPVIGGTLLHPDGSPLVFAADPENDRIAALDTAAGTVTWAVDLPVGSTPFRLTASATHLYASLRDTRQIASIDLASHALSVVDAGCPEPRGIAWDGGRAALWLACASGELERLDADGHVVSSWRVGTDLRDVVPLAGAIAVSEMRAARVLYVDSTSGLVTSAASPDLPLLVLNGEARHFTPQVAWRLRADEEGTGLVMVHQLERTDPITLPGDSDTSEPLRDTAPPPHPPTGQGGSPYGGTDASCDSIVVSAFTRFPAGKPPATIALDSAAVATDVAFDFYNGGWRIAAAGAEGMPVVSPRFEAGTCLEPGAFPSARSVAVVFDSEGQAVVQHQAPFSLEVDGMPSRLGPAKPPADTPPDGRVALDLFTAQTGAGLACASCHPEGQDDGHVWTFEDGPRRTQNLAGGIASTAPYHWTGEFATFGDLLADVLVGRMGGEQPSEKATSALTQWLDRIRPIASSPGATAETLARGAQLFADHQCATCHGGPSYTSGIGIDVGTGGVFQPPDLLGVGSRGPWMHDGCASTLEMRFLDPACGGTAHGTPIEADDVGAIVAWLETL